MDLMSQRLLVLVFLLKPILGEDYNLIGLPGQGYCLDVNIGHPSQKFKLLVDTGSATLAVASSTSSKITPYFHAENSTTIVDYGYKINSRYTYSSWEADLVSDYVQIPSQPHIPEVMTDLGLITKDENFYFGPDQNWQGILGLGYGLLAARGAGGVAGSWLQALDAARGHATSFSLELCGADPTRGPYHYGRLKMLDEYIPTTNKSVFTTPVIRQWWYEVGVLDVRVLGAGQGAGAGVGEVEGAEAAGAGAACRRLNEPRGLAIDSGTTNIRLPDEVFHKIVSQLKAAAATLKLPLEDSFWEGKPLCLDRLVDWAASGLPRLGVALPSHAHPTQYFTLELPPESYIHWMRARCWQLALAPGGGGTALGAAALEGLRVTFDKTHNVIHLEESPCGPGARLRGPTGAGADLLALCGLRRPAPGPAPAAPAPGPVLPLQWACAVVLSVAALFLCLLLKPCFVKWFWKLRLVIRNRDSDELEAELVS